MCTCTYICIHVQCTCIIIIGSYYFQHWWLVVVWCWPCVARGARRVSPSPSGDIPSMFPSPSLLQTLAGDWRNYQLKTQRYTYTCMYGKARVPTMSCTSQISYLLLYPLLKPLVPGSLVPITGSSQGAWGRGEIPESKADFPIISFTTYLPDHYWSVWKYQWIYPFQVFNVGLKNNDYMYRQGRIELP
jgi:hypothetical protein